MWRVCRPIYCSPEQAIYVNSNNEPQWWQGVFHVTNGSGRDMLITAVEIDFIGYTADGKPQNGTGGYANNGYVGGFDGDYNKPVTITTELYDYNHPEAGRIKYSANVNTATAPSDVGNWNGVRTLRAEEQNKTVLLDKSQQSLAMKVRVDPVGNLSDPYYVGIQEIRIYGNFVPVPEPATTSLSLLGLTALMMRRRRA